MFLILGDDVSALKAHLQISNLLAITTFNFPYRGEVIIQNTGNITINLVF